MARTPISGLKTEQVQRSEQAFVTPRLEIANQTLAGRSWRKPAHQWRLSTKPWDIQPCFIAPVLPGETLKSLQLQSRVITDPILNRVVGWWKEYYVFYVKHTDIPVYGVPDETGTSPLINMHLTNASISAMATSASSYSTGIDGSTTRIDWVANCLKAVVPWYFRDQDEPLAGYDSAGGTRTGTGVGTIYRARAADLKWMDSLKIEDVNPTPDSNLPGMVAATQLPPHLAQFSAHLEQWQYMRETKLTEVSFEDYLETFGVRVPAQYREVQRRPELVRYIREWQYPSNAVDGATGTVSSAVSWAIRDRADKARAFKEPGFLFGVTVARPKVFFGKQKAPAVSMLDDAFGWMPAILRDDPFTSLIEYDHNEGPLADILNSADDYWVDRRDLYLYGDDFVNFPVSARTGGDVFVTLPKSGTSGTDNVLDRYYVTEADGSALFVDSTGANFGDFIREDGVVNLGIASHLKETT